MLDFKTGGELTISVDCHAMETTYALGDSNSISIGPFFVPSDPCPENEPLASEEERDIVVNALLSVVEYTASSRSLVLTASDSTILRFNADNPQGGS